MVRSAFFGLLDNRLRWGLSARGWAAAGGTIIAAVGAGILGVHGFLAPSAPLDAPILVVEGWMPEYVFEELSVDIQSGKYKHVYTVGGPASGVQEPAADDDTHAYVARKRFLKAGVNSNLVEMVPSGSVDRDRTFTSAVALRQRLQQSGINSGLINVATLGVHARRTQYLFRRALGDDFKVGIISIRNREYDPHRWWRYSEGVKEIVSEGSAFLYARFFFSPN